MFMASPITCIFQSWQEYLIEKGEREAGGEEEEGENWLSSRCSYDFVKILILKTLAVKNLDYENLDLKTILSVNKMNFMQTV
jgi:hypothetical protein